ncbi:MAG: hypothetical protein J6Y21_00330, partial [Clostridia bacterium]|nr:hypothetical protein [Clostridia bacterium]
PWRHDSDRSHWTAFAYDDPAAGESVLLAFRMEDAQTDNFTVKLPFAVPGSVYSLTNADNGFSVHVGGRELSREGFTVTLREPKSSALFYIKRI